MGTICGVNSAARSTAFLPNRMRLYNAKTYFEFLDEGDVIPPLSREGGALWPGLVERGQGILQHREPHFRFNLLLNF